MCCMYKKVKTSSIELQLDLRILYLSIIHQYTNFRPNYRSEGGAMMDLSNLRPAEGSVKSDNFRRGRGHGSGNGKTAGKGHKGQKARSGAPRLGFEGGQMPLYRRIPKRGFKNRNRLEIVAIIISALEKFDNGADVTVDTLIESGIVKNPKDGVKILGNGELTKKLNVKANAFSASA